MELADIARRLEGIEQRLDMVAARAQLTEDLLVQVIRIHPNREELLARFEHWQEQVHAKASNSAAVRDIRLETLQLSREILVEKSRRDVDR